MQECARQSSIDETLGGRGAPVTNERMLVTRVIDFANGRTNLSPVRAWLRTPQSPFHEDFADAPLAGSPTEETAAFPEIDLAGIRGLSPPTDEELDAYLKQWRDQAFRMLAAAINERHGIEEFLSDQALSFVVKRLALKRTSKNSEVTWQLDLTAKTYPTRMRALLCFTAAILHKDFGGLRAELRQCDLQTCGRFFLIDRSKGGKPRTKYCNKICAKKQHNAKSAERKRRSRSKQRQARKLKRRQP